MEIINLPDTEFKLIVTGRFTKLRRINEHRELRDRKMRKESHIKDPQNCPSWFGFVDRASAYGLKCPWFDSAQGPVPQL